MTNYPLASSCSLALVPALSLDAKGRKAFILAEGIRVPDVLWSMILQFPHSADAFRNDVSRRRMLRDDSSKTPTLLTPKEVAAILRISERSVINMAGAWIDSGGQEGIPAFRLGPKLWRFNAVEFRRWLENKGLFSESKEVMERLQKAQ